MTLNDLRLCAMAQEEIVVMLFLIPEGLGFWLHGIPICNITIFSSYARYSDLVLGVVVWWWMGTGKMKSQPFHERQ